MQLQRLNDAANTSVTDVAVSPPSTGVDPARVPGSRPSQILVVRALSGLAPHEKSPEKILV